MSVYFITARQVNAVKIGSSLEPYARLRDIQTHCPLELVVEAILPGNQEEEFTFHRRFEDDRIRGEWFTINEMIEAIIANNPPPPRPHKSEIDQRKRLRWERKREKRETAAPYCPVNRSDQKRYAAAMADMRAEQERLRQLETTA